MNPMLLQRWPILALLVSAALVGGAHAFETFGHLPPCAMCLAQREWHWGIMTIAAVALIARGEARWSAFVIGLAYLGSFAMAGWHVGVEQHWIEAQCEVTSGTLDNLSFDLNAKLELPQCDNPLWSMFGITMAGYNALISAAMALIGLTLAFAGEPVDEDLADG